MKIDNDTSRKIYELAINTAQVLTNAQIAAKYDITEGNVRYHIKKWESTVHEIAQNDQRVNAAVTKNTLNVIDESLMQISNIKESILQARTPGVSPEKLSGLFNNWIRALELSSELLGKIDRAPVTNIQFNAEFNELKAVIIGELCPAYKAKIKGRLHEIAGN